MDLRLKLEKNDCKDKTADRTKPFILYEMLSDDNLFSVVVELLFFVY